MVFVVEALARIRFNYLSSQHIRVSIQVPVPSLVVWPEQKEHLVKENKESNE